MTLTPEGREPKRVVEEGYDRVALDYARLEGKVAWPRLRWLGKLLGKLEPGAAILDLGCGSGDPAGIEIAREHDLTGVDISQVPMFISCYDPETMEAMVSEAGFEVLETATETQLEGGQEVPFFWLLARKRAGMETD